MIAAVTSPIQKWLSRSFRNLPPFDLPCSPHTSPISFNTLVPTPDSTFDCRSLKEVLPQPEMTPIIWSVRDCVAHSTKFEFEFQQRIPRLSLTVHSSIIRSFGLRAMGPGSILYERAFLLLLCMCLYLISLERLSVRASPCLAHISFGDTGSCHWG